MKKCFIIANWKANKTLGEVVDWFKKVGSYSQRFSGQSKLEVIVCPPALYLPVCKELINEKNYVLKLGAQNVSQFDNGPFTGEISARQLSQFADYVIIGHSERRLYFSEDAELIRKKVEISVKFSLTPILCVGVDQQNELASLSDFKMIVAYEPISAISTMPDAKPETVEKVGQICRLFSKLINGWVVYGGSVGLDNIGLYLSKQSVSGVLIGKHSLDADFFIKLIEIASRA